MPKKKRKCIDFADYMTEEELERLEKVMKETRVSDLMY